MTQPPPHVAVVIPCYNAEAWIDRTIGSVLDQDYAPLSVIVVDDGSTDGSAARLEAHGDAILWETGPNRGGCHARNRGAALAAERGAEYLVFLDADDYFEGDILRGAAGVARARDADMVLSNMHLEFPGGRREERVRYAGHVAPEAFFEGWMEGDYVNPSAILWRAAFVARIGGWDESLARAQDLDITLRAMLEDPVIWKNEEGAAIFDQANPDSVSRTVSRHATESRLRVQKQLLARIEGTSFARFAPLLCREVYSIARTAFRTGQTDLGREGVAILRAHDYRDHPGTRAHRIAARLLGLETKIRLWRG